METAVHLELKRLAVEWLTRLGCRAIATEVRCPLSRWRIDVAGWLDHAPDGPLGEAAGRDDPGAALFSMRRTPRPVRGDGDELTAMSRGRTILVECKQSRSDFLRDDLDRAEQLRIRDDLERRREEIEAKLLDRAPASERDTLFPVAGGWRLETSSDASHRRVMRELRRAEKRLYGQTKFHLLTRYRLGDHLVLFTPSGLVRAHEVPTGWGLVEASGPRLRHPTSFEPDAPLPLRERIASEPLDSPVRRRLRLLRNIAVANSR